MKTKGKLEVHMWGYKCIAHLLPFPLRDWLTMLSPPIVPPSQQPAEQPLESSASASVQGKSTRNALHNKYKGNLLQIEKNRSL